MSTKSSTSSGLPKGPSRKTPPPPLSSKPPSLTISSVKPPQPSVPKDDGLRYLPTSEEIVLPDIVLDEIMKGSETPKSIRHPAQLSAIAANRVTEVDENEPGTFRSKLAGSNVPAIHDFIARARTNSACSDAGSGGEEVKSRFVKVKSPISEDEESNDLGSQLINQDNDDAPPSNGNPAAPFSAETLAAGSFDELGPQKTVLTKDAKVFFSGQDDVDEIEKMKRDGESVVQLQGEGKPAYKFKTGVGRKRRSKLYVEFRNWMINDENLSLLSGPGATGQIMTICLFLITTSSVSAVRRKQFEQFWLTHHLIAIFFACMLAHGTFCFIQADSATPCRGPNTWKYFVGFGSFYILERIVRGLRARFPTKIWKVVQHPSGVVEVQIKKRWWFMRSGQYIFLNCPELSRYQWHPFTLTSAPEEDFLSVHIRVAGDWTTAFAKRLGCNWDDEKKGRKGVKEMMDGSGDKDDNVAKRPDGPILGKAAESILPRVMVDGPYGAASVVINKQFKISYYTGRMKEEEISNIMLNQKEEMDALTGLRSPTIYGRPNLDAIFQKLNLDHPNADAGVFFCGPKPLSKMIHRACNKYTSVDEDGTRFYYHKENF
ncbi:hypothetical protein HDU67_009303 [Dinochytrium kinnereticum]|nr:hypothetical protein HDU67_009303 [Dinochytrium kinnereticum]